MLYTTELLDRKTGELTTIDNGDWITITELGELYNAGPRRVRTILRRMGFLQVEGGGRQQRHRLCSWVTNRGWGKRVQPKGSVPFDVIGPQAREWIMDRWTATVAEVEAEKTEPLQTAKAALERFRDERNSFRHERNCLRSHQPAIPDMDMPEMVSWLSHFYPALSHADIASILEVSQQLVSRYLAERRREVNGWNGFRKVELEAKPWASSGVLLDQL